MNWAHTDLATKGYNHQANPRINPAYLQISKGSLVGAVDASASREGEEIKIIWADNSMEANANPSDQVSILLNQPEIQKHLWLQNIAKRKDLSVSIPLSPEKLNMEWELYLVFYRPQNNKRLLISDSQYLGRR